MSALSTLPTTESHGRWARPHTDQAAAIDLAARMRILHQDLSEEFGAAAPPGRVLALAVRSGRALRRGGCSDELLPAATERLVRAEMGRRGAVTGAVSTLA